MLTHDCFVFLESFGRSFWWPKCKLTKQRKRRFAICLGENWSVWSIHTDFHSENVIPEHFLLLSSKLHFFQISSIFNYDSGFSHPQIYSSYPNLFQGLVLKICKFHFYLWKSKIMKYLWRKIAKSHSENNYDDFVGQISISSMKCLLKRNIFLNQAFLETFQIKI